MTEVSNPIEDTVKGATPTLPLNRNTYIVGGLVVIGALVMFTRSKSVPASSTSSQPTAEPNTNVMLGSLQQMIADYGGRNSQALAATQQQIAAAQADQAGISTAINDNVTATRSAVYDTGLKLSNQIGGVNDNVMGTRTAVYETGLNLANQASGIQSSIYDQSRNLSGQIAGEAELIKNSLAYFPESSNGYRVAA